MKIQKQAKFISCLLIFAMLLTDKMAVFAEEIIEETEAAEEASSSQEPEGREEAKRTFEELADSKDLMALIYLTDECPVYREADFGEKTGDVLESGHTVLAKGVEITEGNVWYYIFYYNGSVESAGYVPAQNLAFSDEEWINWREKYLVPVLSSMPGDYPEAVKATAMDEDIAMFPSGYWDGLNALKRSHPNWIFVAMKTGLDFQTSVTKEKGDKSLVQKTAGNVEKGYVGAACSGESGWYYATEKAIADCMNPLNFLTESAVFQFEQLTYNASYHSQEAVQSFLNGTFMKGELPKDTAGRNYAAAFFEIGSSRKLSPIHLASRVYQEQGAGTSPLISGNYPGYEGYYNYFNINVSGATDTEKYVKGLTYAKDNGWDTPYKSLAGGAAKIGNNYILKGQDTIYLEKFNVNKSSPYGVYEHQYMQNIQAPASEAASSYKMYKNAGSLNSPFVFKIPVYDNMDGLIFNEVEGIALNESEITLKRPDTVLEGEENTDSFQLQVSVIPEDASEDTTCRWTSGDEKVATVDDSGLVRAVGTGETTITATLPGVAAAEKPTASCVVKVIAPICRIALTDGIDQESSADIQVGQKLNLSLEYWPKDTTDDTTVEWVSDHPEFVRVNNGQVTGVTSGSAEITAVISGISASFQINVKANRVRFRNKDNTCDLKTLENIPFGGKIPKEEFPDMTAEETASGDKFLGWYTGADGSGSRFDENSAVYEGEILLYPCFQAEKSGFYVVPVGDQIYTGSAVKPEVVVYDAAEYEDGSSELVPLKLNQDYTISYQNNKNPDVEGKPQPQITIKGKGNYEGTKIIFFHILRKSLKDDDITAESITASYTGQVIKNKPTICRNGRTLVNGTDYTISYPQTGAGAYQKAGIYPVVVTGKGGYRDSVTVYETITQKVLMSKVSVTKLQTQSYDRELVQGGLGMRPSFTVSYQGVPLEESPDGGVTGDYVLEFENHMAVGTATVKIIATEGSRFTGTKVLSYKITGIPIKGSVINGVEDKVFTGNREDVWQKDISVIKNGVLLQKSMDGGVTGDYVVSYLKDNGAGTATVVCTGINAYTGTVRKTYKIAKCDLTQLGGEKLRVVYVKYTPYEKGGVKPEEEVYVGGRQLIRGRDYTVSYKNYDAVTKAEMPPEKRPMLILSGKGNYSGKLTEEYEITDGCFADTSKISVQAKDVVYKKKPGSFRTSLTITDCNGKTLQAGKDYEKEKNYEYTYLGNPVVRNEEGDEIPRREGDLVESTDIPQAGTRIKVTVCGMGYYAGEGGEIPDRSAEYRIIAADISRAQVSVKQKTYQNGRKVYLKNEDMKVTLNGETLTLGTDYEIDADTYLNNDRKGTASVEIYGIADEAGQKNYGGRKKITFKIGSRLIFW